MRAKGINLAAVAGSIGSVVVGQFFPVAIANIASKTYFIFFAINLASIGVRPPPLFLSPFRIHHLHSHSRAFAPRLELFGKDVN
jgi:hypothetical protein